MTFEVDKPPIVVDAHAYEGARVKRDYIAFHLAHEDCRERMLRGETSLVWPPGTWAMGQHFGQRASPLSTAA